MELPTTASYRSPLILWRFRRGLAPGVLSRCGRCISLANALSITSVSNRAVRVESRPVPLRIRRVDAWPAERASKRPRPPCSGEDACALATDGDFSSLIATCISSIWCAFVRNCSWQRVSELRVESVARSWLNVLERNAAKAVICS